MADEAPSIGTASIRRVVEATRAQSATGIHAPAPPPDMSAAPWASPMPPQPDNTTTPAAQASRQARENPGPMTPPERRPRKTKVATPDFSRQAKAWNLVDRLMSNWSEDSKSSLGKANNLLSQRLARNGITIIREGISIGQIADLVRLCNELAHQGKDEAEDDPRILKMQEDLKREIPDFGTEEATGGGEEGEDDGE